MYMNIIDQKNLSFQHDLGIFVCICIYIYIWDIYMHVLFIKINALYNMILSRYVFIDILI
jgi:hypothetical protein